ncbi:MAG: hypothetical protein EZS28_025632, partial [Streblomastix strix]
WHRGDNTVGNNRFEDDVHVIGMELNMHEGTLHFFCCGEQQKVFIEGIREPVLFYGYIFYRGTSMTVLRLSKLSAPTVAQLKGEKAVRW